MQSFITRSLLSAGLALTLTTPAGASTVPPVDLKAGQLAIAGGVGLPLDLSLDYALTDRLSLGASYIPLSKGFVSLELRGGVPFVSAARASYRIGEGPWGMIYGLTLSGGTTANVWGNLPIDATPTQSIWVQPALNAALPLGPVTLRGTIGPVLFPGNGFLPVPGPFLLWPNLELAWRVMPGQELTLGGNSLVGWRATF